MDTGKQRKLDWLTSNLRVQVTRRQPVRCSCTTDKLSLARGGEMSSACEVGC